MQDCRSPRTLNLGEKDFGEFHTTSCKYMNENVIFEKEVNFNRSIISLQFFEYR